MIVTTTVKGQIVIPAALRRKLGITNKTKIHVSEDEGRIVLTPITRDQINRVRGMFKGAGMLKELYEDRAWERGNDERRFAQWNKTVSSTRRR
jgi:AbrB family looped-hinge helix DNA binding protein